MHRYNGYEKSSGSVSNFLIQHYSGKDGSIGLWAWLFTIRLIVMTICKNYANYKFLMIFFLWMGLKEKVLIFLVWI
jgi:hypothetical protein